MSDWTVEDLSRWDEQIRGRVAEFGLDCYRQEFELCDHHAMLGYMAYHGMPSHYPHWSYGKSFEKTKTLYDYGVSGLPYELVINSDPCLAYLMTDNSLCLQILTIAHVYGHNDFFKNNHRFADFTHAANTIANFKARADRVRGYIEDPSIGDERVEQILDAAHALAFCIGPLGVKQRSQKERERHAEDERYAALEAHDADPWRDLVPRPQIAEEQDDAPMEPVADILAFMRDHHPGLAEWERDLLDIVDAETRYFLPQIETKIMNEGWASYWHHKILQSLDLPHDVRIEFLVRHNQVVCPHPGSINPYHLGFVLWHFIEQGRAGASHFTNPTNGRERRWTEAELRLFPEIGQGYEAERGRQAIFAIRESERDAAFLRWFLSDGIIRDLDLFSYEPKGDKLVVDAVADDEHWEDVKRKLIAQVGTGTNPVIRITDADLGRRRELYLVHDHDGRDLHLGYAERTLQHLYTLWGRRVLLETQVNGQPSRLAYDEGGFDTRLIV